MRKFGIKIWSTDVLKNPHFVTECVKAVKDGKFGYVELFALPETFQETAAKLKAEIGQEKVIIHAPHSKFGVDTGTADAYADNCKKLTSSFQFADLLSAEIIILHAGCGEGDAFVDETIRQFNLLHDSRLCVENLPYFCTATGKILHGASPQQIARIKAETGCGFCFDFSHAVCAANHYHRDIWKDLQQYASLKPSMYHLCDGDFAETADKHLHFGEGNYNLQRLLQDYTTQDALITMETGYGTPNGIEPWLKDIDYIRLLEK